MAANPPLEPRLRWNLVMAAREFNVAPDTLRRRLGDSHEEPGPDGRYTTKQLTALPERISPHLKSGSASGCPLKAHSKFCRPIGGFRSWRRERLCGSMSRITKGPRSRTRITNLVNSESFTSRDAYDRGGPGEIRRLVPALGVRSGWEAAIWHRQKTSVDTDVLVMPAIME
jgi:hypothetical protein